MGTPGAEIKDKGNEKKSQDYTLCLLIPIP